MTVKIALVCQHGASTSMCVARMREEAEKNQLDVEINAYSETQMENLVLEKDAILLAPQMGFKKDIFKNQFPEFADRMDVINTMDFGMMDGKKVLKRALELAEQEK